MSGTPGEVSFSSVCESELIGPSHAMSRATGKKRGRNLFCGDGDHARAHIFTAFCIVRRGCEHRPRPTALSIQVALVEFLDPQPELLRLAAHFLERSQTTVNVEHRVLESLGHDRAGSLLKL